MNAYLDAIRNYATFSGRSSRSQYWWFILIVTLIGIVGIVLDVVILGASEPSLFTGLVTLVHFIPSIALTVRRLHDADRTGWLVLLGLIPLVNLIAFVVFGLLGSIPGRNRFDTTATQPAQGGPVAAERTGTASNIEQLEKLASLRASGAIDDTEYGRMKADLLNSNAN